MPSFLIESYKVRLELQRAGSPPVTYRNRIIEVLSVPLSHGIVERAVLNFSTSFDNWSGSPAVGFYDSVNPLKPVLYAWLPSNEFSFWYDVLRAEKPLTLFYDITPIGGANYVGKITLGTSTEPLGEGPKDVTP